MTTHDERGGPGRRRAVQRCAARQRGVVTLEFLVVIPTTLLLLMGTFQVLHLHVARQLVGHAAHRAARAASLWTTEAAIGSSRVDVEAKVHEAAASTLVPISPARARPFDGPTGADWTRRLARVGASGDAPPQAERWTFGRAFDRGTVISARGASKADYALHATRVEVLDDGADGRAAVQVQYAFACGLPVASAMCDRLDTLGATWQDRLGARGAGLAGRGRYLILTGTATHVTAPRPGG